MYTKQEIILKYHREGKSQRSICRELKISRKTVRRYLTNYDSHLEAEASANGSGIGTYLSSASVYNSQNRGKRRLTPQIQEAIDELLLINQQHKQAGLGKQLLKKSDILEQLQQRGFSIGYTSVCNYIRSKLDIVTEQEAYIRQQYAPGQSCEFDWGEVKLWIGGVLCRLQLAVFTSCYSNYRYGRLYVRQDTLSFMESHVSFFKSLGHVYPELVYDNMRVAVAKFTGTREKEPTQALLQLRGHYLFTHRFCNVRRGNEKGHVERSVEYVRRKSFGLKTRFEDLESANEWLSMRLIELNATQQQQSGKSADQLFEEEKPYLPMTPVSMLCAEQVQLRADKYATVSYKTNRYSVPDHLVGKFVDVKVLSDQLHLYEGGQKIAQHVRSYEKHEWVVRIDHYLTTFKRKPGALASSVALASSDQLKTLYEAYFQQSPRDFIDLLCFCRENQISDASLACSVERLVSSGVRYPGAEQLMALMGNKSQTAPAPDRSLIGQQAKNQLLQIASLFN